MDKEEEIANAVQVVLDTALDRLAKDDETFIHCHVCDEVDGHTRKCFIPTLEAWMNSGK